MLNKNLEQVYRKLQGYLISRFNKYPRNPRNLLFLKLISPTVLCWRYYIATEYTVYVNICIHMYIANYLNPVGKICGIGAIT